MKHAMANLSAEHSHANSSSQPKTMQMGMGVPPPSSSSAIQLVSKIPKILPHERVFPIQIGSELFKLSGASISSDGE